MKGSNIVAALMIGFITIANNVFVEAAKPVRGIEDPQAGLKKKKSLSGPREIEDPQAGQLLRRELKKKKEKTAAPSVSLAPSRTPSGAPSGAPSVSLAPSRTPSGAPTGAPSVSLAPSTSAAPSSGKGSKKSASNSIPLKVEIEFEG